MKQKEVLLGLLTIPLEIKTNDCCDGDTDIRIGPVNGWRKNIAVFDMANEDPEYAYDEAQAYAALIAVSPELAKACLRLVAAYVPGAPADPAAVKMAYEALKKLELI